MSPQWRAASHNVNRRRERPSSGGSDSIWQSREVSVSLPDVNIAPLLLNNQLLQWLFVQLWSVFTPFTRSLHSIKSLSTARQDSSSLLALLSPPTQLLAATLCVHHCQCHCHPCAQHVPTPPLTFPHTERGPWNFSC